MPELAPELLPVARAMALLWTFRTRAAILNLTRGLGYEGPKGDPLKLQDVTNAVARMLERGQAQENPEREGLVRLPDDLRAPLYADLLAKTMALDLQRALHDLEKFRPEDNLQEWSIPDPAATIALFRLAAFSGTPAERLRQMADAIARRLDWESILEEAVFAVFDPALAGRLDPAWRSELVSVAATRLCLAWRPTALPVLDWALSLPAAECPDAQRLDLAEVALHRGDAERVRTLLADIDNGSADALRAGLLVQAGQYAEAQSAFEAALKRRQGEASARRRLLPASIAWYYPLALLAQRSPTLLEPALKFCIGEAGERSPEPSEGWGIWAHAIAVRLGETTLDPNALTPRPTASLDELWRLLAAAWLGGDAIQPAQRWDETVRALRAALQASRFAWLAEQVEAAHAALHGQAAKDSVVAGGEPWREVLASLQALAGEAGATAEEMTRLLWALRIGPEGVLEDIEVLEQKHGPRGWGTPHPANLARLAGEENLAPHDARVARAIRPDRDNPRRFTLDLATAVLALVEHPTVALAEAPEQPIELIEAPPEIETARSGDGFVIRLRPPLRSAAEEDDPLSGITLIRESPLRVRLVRFSPAQRRAARLVGDGLALPAAAQAELRQTLQALASHFQVQGEQARGARDVAADPRLRAELSPVGEHLLLRLVVAPLGPDGPRLAPGRGRARLMASVGGETLSARRDLPEERKTLEAVLDAFDFLDEPDPGAASCEWTIDDPEASLDLLERLPRLPGIASLDWPKGQPLRVVGLDRGDLRLQIRRERDGFHLDGIAMPEAGAAVRLGELLAAAARGESRFIPMGEGLHFALTRELKRRLADLDALAEEDGEGVRLPRIAGAWLEDLLAGMSFDADEAARGDMERLRRLEDEPIEPPRELRAELRPYQEEGFRWAMRLAAAGFGGCLADDMGLGKTLQAIALLLARADGGPALILAPTSVAGNWRAELERFAPGLEVRLYGESQGDEASGGAPGRVVIASYGLFLLNEEHFAATRWHTVVADEAQAIKNAEAKRSQAAFSLEADFRLALTGTPVENRLAELWSIMHFVNPGLLGSLERFTRRFASPIEKKRDRHAQRALRRLVGPFILRRTKAQVLQELPPRTETLLTVIPDDTEAAHYEALRRDALDEAGRALADDPDKARINILALLTRLRRAACDPRLVTPEFAVEGAKVLTFADLAADLSSSGHKALVFSQFVDFLHLLQPPLDAAGIPYQYLDGAVPAAERTRRIAAFQAGEGDLFLISLKAGGFGLNLTAADYVVITDPWWNPAAEDQAMGRAHRFGQQRPVTVYRMISRGTVEERIVRLHRDKRALAESVLAEGGAPALPSAEDLLALVRETMS